VSLPDEPFIELAGYPFVHLVGQRRYHRRSGGSSAFPATRNPL